MGGHPSVVRQPSADFHIVRAGIRQDRVEDLMKLMAGIVAVHNIGGQGMVDNTGQIFQKKTEGIVQGNFSLSDQKPVKRPVKTADIYAETWRGNAVAGIVKISYPVKGGLVIWILFQGKDQIGGFLCRAQYRRGKISEGSASGGDDGEIHADQDHGIGYDRSGHVQKALYGSVHHPGFKQRLIPFFVLLKDPSRKLQKIQRIGAGDQTDVRILFQNIRIPGRGKHRHAPQRILQKIGGNIRGNIKNSAGKSFSGSVVTDGVFQTGITGKLPGSLYGILLF